MLHGIPGIGLKGLGLKVVFFPFPGPLFFFPLERDWIALKLKCDGQSGGHTDGKTD